MVKGYDITPQLVLSAYNTQIQFCRKLRVSEEGCNGCIFDNRCPGYKDMDPADWEEIHYPRMTSNTTIKYAKSLKKELGSARAEVKKVTDVFKNAFKLDESQALRSVRSTMQKVKAVVSSVTPKLGFKGKMQEFQIKAGIKVPTEEFQNVENSMDKLQQKVNALLQDEQALSEMGKNQGMSDKYRNLYQSAKEAENALDKLKRKQQELNESGNGTEFTAKYQNAYEQMMNERDRLTSLQKEKNARMAKKLSLSDVTQDGKMINLDEKIAKTQKNIENLAKSMQSLESKLYYFQ